MDGGFVVDVTSCFLNHAWQFADHNYNNLVSNVIIAVSVFVFFCFCTGAKFFLIALKGVRIKANFCQDENVLGVRRASRKFGSFVYFISVAMQFMIKGYMKFLRLNF